MILKEYGEVFAIVYLKIFMSLLSFDWDFEIPIL